MRFPYVKGRGLFFHVRGFYVLTCIYFWKGIICLTRIPIVIAWGQNVQSVAN